MAPQLLIREDNEISEFVCNKFESENIKILTSYIAKEFKVLNNKNILVCENNKNLVELEFDEIIIALGRKANVNGFGLEKLKIELNPNHTIHTDDFLRTNYPNIFACGDVVGPYQFTHAAAHQAWFATVNSLFGSFKKFKVDYRVMPWVTFLDPEIARVGLNEKDAIAQNIPYELTKYGIDDLDRAIADSSDYGFIKVLTQPKKDKILGVTIVSNHASDILAEFVLAMKYNIGLEKILATIHPYPTMPEANKYVAGNWKKNHISPTIMKLLEKFHSWRV